MCSAPLCRWAERCCSKSCAGKLQALDPVALERLRTLAVGLKRDHAAYSAGAAKRSADPVCRERMRAAARKRNEDPEIVAKIAVGIKKWCGDHPREVLLRAAKIAKTIRASGVLRVPRPAQSAAMLRRWRDPVEAQKYLDVIGTNHAPEYLDRTGRLWRFKSTWEHAFARALDAAELTWLYEPERWLLSTGRTYIPDFWIAELETYVELKAAHRSTDKADQAIADGHPVRVLQGLAAIRAFQASLVEAPA